MQCDLAAELRNYIQRRVEAFGGDTRALKPGHRTKFQWPPHPESYGHHVLSSDWTGRMTVTIESERFEVETARTSTFVFGRIPELWFEAKGRDASELDRNLRKGAKPLLDRQRLVAETLEKPGRFTGRFQELDWLDLLKLLYCPDRDVANDGRREIETHASSGVFLPPLLVILKDASHPYRRSAQWAVLDLLEDLGSFCRDESETHMAVQAIRQLICDAPDDYARTIYKAGVVLGGHMPFGLGGPALMECLKAPSKIGRRSAIHGCYHLAEWSPERTEDIISQLSEVANKDPEPLLRDYAMDMIEDIARADTIHVEDLTFPDEP